MQNEVGTTNGVQRRWLEILGHRESGGVIEVCSMIGGTVRRVGYFDNYERAGEVIAEIDERHKENVFVTLNPAKRELLARASNRLREATFKDKIERTKDHEIYRDGWFLIDVDPLRASGISSTKEEKDNSVAVGQAVLNWLVEIGLPGESTLIAMSGNGIYILIKTPLFEPTKEHVERKKAVLNFIADLFDTEDVAIDRSVFNPARLIGALGTVKRKGDNTLDRPHRRSFIANVAGEDFNETMAQIVAPYDVYALIRVLMPKPEATAATKTKNGQSGNAYTSGGFDIRDQAHLLSDKKETARGFTYYTCPNCEGFQKLHVNEHTGAYGCFHIGAGSCSIEGIREGLGRPKNHPIDRPSQNGHATLKAKQADKKEPEPAKSEVGNASKEDSLIRDVCMSDVRAEKVEWLWEGRIPLHSITIIEGIEGVGKSTLLCAITAAVTLGCGLPGMADCEPGNVVWLSAEDDLARVLKPRLQAVGADCSRVFAVGDPFTFDQRGEMALKEIVANREPKLVIIDPIFAYTKGDANKGGDSRALTNMLKILSENFACAVTLVRHVGKSKGLGDPRAAGLYSIEWRAASRSVLLVGCDPDDQQKRAITQTKCNFGPPAESLGYTITPDSDSPSGARFYWTGKSDLTAERILETVGKLEGTAGETNARDDAEEFLRSVLGDGPMPATDVEKEAKEAKISIATLRRAKDSLGVKARSRGFGKDKKWYWVMPEELDAPLDAHVDAKALIVSDDEHLRANQTHKSNYVNEFALDAHPEMNERLSEEPEHLSNGSHLFQGEFTDAAPDVRSEDAILDAIAE